MQQDSARQIVADISKKVVSVEVRVQRVRKQGAVALKVTATWYWWLHPQSNLFIRHRKYSARQQKKVVILHKILLQSFGPVSSIEHELWDKLLQDNILLKQLFFFPQLRVSIHIHGLYFYLGIWKEYKSPHGFISSSPFRMPPESWQAQWLLLMPTLDTVDRETNRNCCFQPSRKFPSCSWHLSVPCTFLWQRSKGFWRYY